MAAYTLRQLAALLVTYVARRRADKARRVEALAVFAHVYADEGVRAAEHVFGQLLCQVRFAHAGRAEEHERTDGVVGLFQPYAVALYGFHHFLYGLVLRYYGLLEFRAHVFQAHTLGFSHALYRHAGNHRHNVGHVLIGDNVALAYLVVLPLLLKLFQFGLQFGLLVAVACGQFEVLVPYGGLLFLLHVAYLLLLFAYFRRHLGVLQMYACAHFVHGVDGLVGESTVGYVTVCQFDTRHNGIVRVRHVVVILVAFLYVVQYFYGFLGRGRLYYYLLEASFKRAVLLDGVAVFVKRRCADALYRAACQRGLQYVGRVHRARCGACAHERMYFVDENHHVGVLFYFLY